MLVIVLLALFDRLFLGRVLDRLSMIDQEIASQKSSIVRDLRILSYKDTVMKEGEIFKKYITKDVPDTDVVNADFLGLIEKLATQSKVNLVKSNPANTNKSDRFIEYFANLDCNGQLEDVISFMHQINATDGLLKIVKFNMSPKRGSDNEVNASMTVVKLVVP